MVIAVFTALVVGATEIAVLARVPEGRQSAATVDAQAAPAATPVPAPVPTAVPTAAPPPTTVVPLPTPRTVTGRITAARPVEVVAKARTGASTTAARPHHDSSRRHSSDQADGHDDSADHVAAAPEPSRPASAAASTPAAAQPAATGADRRQGVVQRLQELLHRPPVVLDLLRDRGR